MIIIGIIVVITIMISIYYPFQTTIEFRSDIKGNVTINGKILEVELADETEERSQGLMFRKSMARDTGMLFIFDEEGFYSFWMMNMNFNLDIIWIKNNGSISHIERDVPSCFISCPSYSSRDSARYVLELNSGVAKELGLQVGSFVDIPNK